MKALLFCSVEKGFVFCHRWIASFELPSSHLQMNGASVEQEAAAADAETKKEKGVSKATAQKLLAKYKQLQVAISVVL